MVSKVCPLPKFQECWVIVPLEVSVNTTVSGLPPLVGDPVNEAPGAVISPQHTRPVNVTVSIDHPDEATLLSEAVRQRSCTACPEALAGNKMADVMNPPELPLQQRRPA